MKEYRLSSRPLYWLFVGIMPCLFVGGGAVWMWAVAFGPGPDRGLVWLGVLWWLLMLVGCYRQVRVPHTIEVSDAGAIRFVGKFRDSSIQPQDVISVKGGGLFAEVKHTNGKILLLQQSTGFHEFLTELKRANPSVAMRGV